MQVDPMEWARAFALFSVLIHLFWIILIRLDIASTVMENIKEIHFIKSDMKLAPFDCKIAFKLLLTVAVVAAAMGYLFGASWNYVN
jgi:hypothetical protein